MISGVSEDGQPSSTFQVYIFKSVQKILALIFVHIKYQYKCFHLQRETRCNGPLNTPLIMI